MVAISDGGPMERLARVVAEPSSMDEICRRVLAGDMLKDIARDWGLPRFAFEQWLADDGPRWAKYGAALRMRAHQAIEETVPIADAEGDASLRVGTRFKLAERWDPARYGRQGAIAASVRVVVDRSCGVSAAGTRVESETTAVAVDLGVL